MIRVIGSSSGTCVSPQLHAIARNLRGAIRLQSRAMLQLILFQRGRCARVSAAVAIVLAAFLGNGCNLFNNSSTSPSSTTTETFAGTLSAQAPSIYTFTVMETSTVAVTLVTLGATATTAVGLGLGTPSGTTACTMTSTNPTAVAGSTPQISVSENPGTYCVEIYNVGNVLTSATFSITIAHS